MEIFLIVLSFIIRLLPRIIKPNKTDSDTWYHISSVMSIYNNGMKIPKCNDGYILGGKYDYPYLAHLIVAFFSKSNILKYERFIGPLVDTFYIIVGFYYFSFILNYYDIKDNGQLINFLLLLVFSPSMLKISTGPRIYSFTPRVFGELFIFIYFISLHMYLLDDNIIFLILAILFGSFALNTTTFGSQVLVLFSLILSILLENYLPLITLILSLIFAFIISGGHYFNIIKQQLKYTKQYALYGQFNHPALQKRNRLIQYVNFFKYLFKLKLKNAYTIFHSDLVFINIIYKNFDVIIAFGILFLIDLEQSFIENLFLSGLIIFLVTSFRPFLFLGESDRYFDYLVIFSIVLISLYLPQNIVNIILIINIIYYIMTLFLYFSSSERYGKDYLDAMVFIRNNIGEKNKYVIHGILNSYINYSLYVLSDINALAIETNYVYDLAKDKRLMPKDTLYTNDFNYLYHKYGVNIIIANKKYLYNDIMYNFSDFKVFYENSKYIVYIRKIT
jgi:hypothetical protein